MRFTLLFAVALLLVSQVGCQSLGISTEIGYAKIPGSLIDPNLPSDSVFVFALNPDNDREINAYYRDGGKRFEYKQKRSPVINMWGQVVTDIDSNRAEIFDGYLERSDRLINMLIAQGFIRPPGQPGTPADNRLDAVLRAIDELSARIARFEQ